ncbi:MAG: hypothetical protein PHN37_00455 [Candidatus Pacebacteria bacterium]|nr:hypothetical protein [Candidatus Paceibacterota bacterium]
MAIEIRTKKEKLNWSFFLFIISCLMILFFSISYFLFLKNIKNIDQEVDELKQGIKEEEALQKDLSDVEQRLKKAQDILVRGGIINITAGEETKASFAELKVKKAFQLLQENVHPNIWFSSLNFDSNTNKVVIQGEAQDIISFKQQLNILKEKMKFNLIGYSITGDQKVNFTFDFNIDTQTIP